MVLRSMPPPAWLSGEAPQNDVVLSSRTRIMRNLRGATFVHRAQTEELMQVMQTLLTAARRSGLELETFKALTNAERDYLVGCRLVSPDFPWTLPARAYLVDQERRLSMMVNEEDHLRLQALTGGWSIERTNRIAQNGIDRLAEQVDFAFSPRFGYLSASPINLGRGRRQSAMFHLIGLAQGKRLPPIMTALAAKGITVRGLFGEASRAVGAFAQVSTLDLPREEFVGACEYLIREEREARAAVTKRHLEDRASKAKEFVTGSQTISLADALRVLAWIRWAVAADLPGYFDSLRDVDLTLTTLEIRGSVAEEHAARERAQKLREALDV